MKQGFVIRDQYKMHFVTFTIVDWVDVFSRKVYRDIFIDSLKFCRENKEMELFAYAVMSNHVHLIIRSRNGKLSDLIRDIKKFTAQKILKEIMTTNESRKDWMLKRFEFSAKRNSKNSEYNFWQSGNHPEEIYSEKFMLTKLNYIHLNPVRAGIVAKASDYLYCSASNYVGKESLIEIDLVDTVAYVGLRFKEFQKFIDLW